MKFMNLDIDLKREAKEVISRLVEKFDRLTTLEKRNYNEANTRKNFILPLFQALGWNIQEDVIEEDTVLSGRVDYSFKLNHITQFLLEAKQISENLDKDKWAKQTVEYGWNCGVSWVVLSDFEGLKLFNSEINTSHPKPIFDFKYSEYLDNFDKLWLLSKESIEQKQLDIILTGFGIGSKRVQVNDVLANDLLKWRDSLTSNFKAWNTGIDKALLNESVQRIIDRLIFIRVVEDKGIEDKFLWQAFQKWQANSFKPYNFIEALIPLFRKFDFTYNSNLFLEHYCEKLDTEGSPFRTIIPDLYVNKDHQVNYRFDAVNADVLGKVYEQYLGYLQKGREDKGKRKKQGIYYTPTYVVDYIIRNAIANKLQESCSYEDKQSIKILDPTCGSGSFLIKSFDYLDNYFRKLNNQDISDKNTAAIRKYRILSENIFGVDLDEQAIEIAKLNLLLQAVVPNFKLPLLNKHICIGNSLIEDKKLTEKAIDWKEEFPDVFERKNPGFDIIVGNPPYIKEFVNRNAFDNLRDSSYYQGKMDLWTLFACKSIDLLRNGGYLSFIAPNNWISNAGASLFRDKILTEGEIKTFVDFGDYKVFEDAGIQTMILLFKKQKPRDRYLCNYLKIENSEISEKEVNQRLQTNKQTIEIDVEKTIGHNLVFSTSSEKKILDKIKKGSNFSLTENEIAQGIVGAPDECFLLKNLEVFNLEERQFIKPFYTSVGRYEPGITNKYIIYLSAKNFDDKKIENYKNLFEHFLKYKKILEEAKIKYKTPTKPFFYLHREREEKFFVEGKKIVAGIRVNKPSFFYTKKPYYGSRALNFIRTDRIKLEYLTAILNSKVIYYWLKNKGKRLGYLLQVDKGPLLNIPIAITDKEDVSRELIQLTEKIIILKNKIVDTQKNSDEYRMIENKAKTIDGKINKLVYEIYDLNKKEISEIEASLNTISI